MKSLRALLATFVVLSLTVPAIAADDPPRVPPENPPTGEFRATVAKSLDGSVVYCQRDIPYAGKPGQKFILIQKNHHGEDDQNYNVNVEIYMVTCRNHTWVVDHDPFREEYRTPEGEHVAVTYDDFEVYIKNSTGRVIYSGKIRGISRGSFHRMALQFRKTRSPVADYEIMVRAMKHVYLNNRFLYTDYAPFGVFNLRLESGQPPTPSR